jgi:hypothetical protein
MRRRSGKYHSVALGLAENASARRRIGVSSPSTQSRSAPLRASRPALMRMRLSSAGDVPLSKA